MFGFNSNSCIVSIKYYKLLNIEDFYFVHCVTKMKTVFFGLKVALVAVHFLF